MSDWSKITQDADGTIAMATINTADLKRSITLYTSALGYKEHAKGKVSKELAELWNAPAMAGRPFVVLRPESDAACFIRFVQGSPVEGVVSATQWGWTAIEITVQDVYTLAKDIEKTEFEIIGEPKPLDFSDAFIPMQVKGPSNEIVYLNQVDLNLPAFDLPKAKSWVDHMFICVLGAKDMDASLNYYMENMNWQRGNTYDIAYSVLNNAFNLPADTQHRLSMIAQGRKVINEVDQYPSSATARPKADGELPPGISSISYLSSAESPKNFKTSTISDAPYHGAKVSCGLGATGELIELIAV